MYVSCIHISVHSLYPQCPIVHIIAKKTLNFIFYTLGYVIRIVTFHESSGIFALLYLKCHLII